MTIYMGDSEVILSFNNQRRYVEDILVAAVWRRKLLNAIGMYVCVQ